MKYRSLIIDDEPLARKVLRNHISKLSIIELSHECHNAVEAIEFLASNKVDIIFLDIKMPGISGMDFIKTVKNLPDIIITSAYSEYALESYEFSVADYLLKPISFERFLKAVNKVIGKTDKYEPAQKEEENFIFVKSDKIIHKLFLDDIIYLESIGNYVAIQTSSKKLIVPGTLTSLLAALPANGFVRSHKSFVVALKHINSIDGNVIRINNMELFIGRHYRQTFIGALNKYAAGKIGA